MLWVVLIGSVAGLVVDVVLASNHDVVVFGAMLVIVMFVFSGVLAYLAIFPVKLTKQFKDFSFHISNICLGIFGVAVVVLVLLVWWHPYIG